MPNVTDAVVSAKARTATSTGSDGAFMADSSVFLLK